MPPEQVRTVVKGLWTEEQMNEALSCIRNGEKIRAVGRRFGINESTLRRRLKLGTTGGPILGRKAVFTKEEEEEIVNYFLLLTKLFRKISLVELRRMAFEYAEIKNIKHTFNRQTRLAGKDWVVSFMKRNPELGLLKSEPTFIDKVYDGTETSSFYTNLRSLMEKWNVLSHDATNVHEASSSTVEESSSITNLEHKEECNNSS